VLLVAHRTPSSRVMCEQLHEAGARVFEADVQVDRDGRLAVSHYLPVGRGGLLQRDNWRVRWHTGAAHDPRIADVDAVVPPGAAILLDLKGRERAQLVETVVETLSDHARYRVCTSFPDELDRVRRAGFRTWRTINNGRHLAEVLGEGGLADEALTVRHTLLTASTLDRLHALVPTVVAWTVNDQARARRLRLLGVDGLTTDRMSVLRALNGQA
jgi:glycerophosphoryl diester phosphodiesterase